jgi:hypothetical protein
MHIFMSLQKRTIKQCRRYMAYQAKNKNEQIINVVEIKSKYSIKISF